jgi:multidrug efflux system outer membrane protein
MKSAGLVMRRSAVLAGVALALSGCLTLGSKYERPEIAAPEQYRGAVAGAVPGPISDTWWKEFGDPRLDALVDEALQANQDLRLAAARVEEARAIYGEAQSDRYPQVTAGVSGVRTKLSRETSQLPSGVDLTSTRYHAAANLSYELDFWGRLARASEAARAEMIATEEGRRLVEVGLIADVVTGYFDLVSLEEQAEVTRQTIETRTESVRLQKLRYDAGTISELDLAQAEAELAAAEAAAPVIDVLRRQSEDQMGILLGRMGGVPVPDASVRLGALHLPEVPAGLPSDLLTRRADVVAAEQRLVAAHARIAVARAGYFPSINLNRYAGSESARALGLFAAGTNIWSAAASLLAAHLPAGKVTRQVEAARRARSRSWRSTRRRSRPRSPTSEARAHPRGRARACAARRSPGSPKLSSGRAIWRGCAYDAGDAFVPSRCSTAGAQPFPVLSSSLVGARRIELGAGRDPGSRPLGGGGRAPARQDRLQRAERRLARLRARRPRLRRWRPSHLSARLRAPRPRAAAVVSCFGLPRYLC